MNYIEGLDSKGNKVWAVGMHYDDALSVFKSLGGQVSTLPCQISMTPSIVRMYRCLTHDATWVGEAGCPVFNPDPSTDRHQAFSAIIERRKK